MSEGLPLISIIVPVYNVEQYVERCIRSLQAQTYEAIEVILVDDCSTDKSNEICRALIEGDSRFRLFRCPSNGGVSAARNMGLSLATGDLLGFVDPDDYVENEMYEVLYQAYYSSGADVVQCGYYSHLYDGRCQVHTVAKNVCLGRLEALELLFQDRFVKNYVWNKLFDRHLFDSISFPDGRTFEDILIMSDVLEQTTKVCLIQEVEYHYIERCESIVSRALSENQWDDYLHALDIKVKRARTLGVWKNADTFLTRIYLRILDRYLGVGETKERLFPLLARLKNNVNGWHLLTVSPYQALRRFLCLQSFVVYRGVTLFLRKNKKNI